MTGPVLLYATFPANADAEAIARHLIATHLAACVNCLPAITSFYEWEGRLEQAHETALLIKTTYARAAGSIAAIRALHPAECPCIIQLPITGGDDTFLNWISHQTRPSLDS